MSADRWIDPDITVLEEWSGRNSMAIYITAKDTYSGRRHLVDAHGESAAELSEASTARPEPTLRLPGAVLEKLAQTITDTLPAQPAAIDALEDARGLRDRLLRLVEHLNGVSAP